MGISFRYNNKLKSRAKDFRKKKNRAEIILWKELQNRKFHGLNFNREKVIDNFIADFACEKVKIVIEIDGGSHIGREEYDQDRDNILRGYGFDIIRIPDTDIFYHLDATFFWIKERIDKHIKTLNKAPLT